ncbi:uncharacterized protein LOC129234611 [Uloborus diversus]|uniref:uncharacterized protein LOC129234611 n=1 Tax=Uloborus diversus TaxID=327109 RepID=UPI0024094197|nr:uncharacterized protein LOC129234611 [Uloborus diversus]
MGSRQDGLKCWLTAALLMFTALASVTICGAEEHHLLPLDEGVDEREVEEADVEPFRISKRPTVLLNRLMYALQNVIQPSSDVVKQRPQTELQRRGYPRHWKCYFNAVSCFRRRRKRSLESALSDTRL